MAVPKVIILGHKCTYEGHVPNDSKAAKIRDWPQCKNVTDVCAFLGVTGYMRVWIKNYSTIMRPLYDLTRKNQPFIWNEKHAAAMQSLKDAIVHSTALITIDYETDRTVYLAVDSSIQGVRWILSQDCADGRRCPSHFGSITWNERESRYSQAKIELYGLFCALRAMCFHLVGIRKLVVEMDTLYICGMLNNPDVQPNATINHWITAILLFDFKLIHIPAEKHHGPDGLSRHEPTDDEVDEDDDPEDWIDRTLALGIWVVSWLDSATTNDSTAVWTLDTQDAPPLRRSARLHSKANFDSPNHEVDDSSQPAQEYAADTLPPSANETNDLDNNTNDNDNGATAGSLSPNDNPSNDNNATADDQGDTSALSPFPPNTTAAKAEDELLLIHEYLQCPCPPSHLHSEALTRFFRRAAHYTLANDRLWWLQHDG